MRRIQEKLPVETTIWQPVSVPMARFIAFEQMAKTARQRSRRPWAIIIGRSVRTSTGEHR